MAAVVSYCLIPSHPLQTGTPGLGTRLKRAAKEGGSLCVLQGFT